MQAPIFTLNIPKEFKLATRPQGIAARKVVLGALKEYGKVKLDFDLSNPTPSFVDECVGVLCQEIGWEKFKASIVPANLTDTTKSLLKLVIRKRMSEIKHKGIKPENMK